MCWLESEWHQIEQKSRTSATLSCNVNVLRSLIQNIFWAGNIERKFTGMELMVPALGENPYELVEIFRKSVAILNSPSADSTWMDEVADLSQTLKNIYFKTESFFEP